MNLHKNIWGFYPGNHSVGGDFGNDDVFVEKNLVGVGWPLTGDLKTYVREKRSKDELEIRVREAYQYEPDLEILNSDKLARWIHRSAGTLYRFLIEVQIGDPVIYACKVDECIHVGLFIDSENNGYFYDDDGKNNRLHLHFRHFRMVKWTHSIDYKKCSKEELAIVRTQNTFWQMKACPDKFLHAR